MNADQALETPSAFSRRSGLPDKLVRLMVRQGVLPHIKTGRTHVLIHIDAALEALKQRAEQTAEEIAASMPVPIKFRPTEPKTEKRYRGRVPDKIRLSNKG